MKDLLAKCIPYVPADLAEEIHEALQKPAGRATRLPESWRPSPSLMTWAAKERPDVCATRQVGAFTDFWNAKPGKDACKLDWDATFRNWIRNCRADPRPVVRNEPNPSPATVMARRKAVEPPSQAVKDMMAGLAAKLRVSL